MLPQLDTEAIKAGFELVKGAIDTIKGVIDLRPTKSEDKDDLQRRIEFAERQLALGEAQLAQALGYKICRAHWPPVPMLRDRVDKQYADEISKCPKCGSEDPPPEYLARKNRPRQTHAIRGRNGPMRG